MSHNQHPIDAGHYLSRRPEGVEQEDRVEAAADTDHHIATDTSSITSI